MNREQRRAQGQRGPHDVLDGLAARFAGQHIPGGCMDCDAYQTFERDDNIYLAKVHHDDTCPSWQQMQRERP